MRMNGWELVLVIGYMGVAGGCGSDNGRQAVSGTVNFQGKPLENGMITFMTTGSPPAPGGGALVRDGKFDIPADKGLEPGKYRVLISAAGPIAKQTRAEIAAKSSPRATELIPAKYNTSSTLQADVTAGGKNQFEFNLE